MDLVLEVCDSFLFDKLYSTVLPASLAAGIPPQWQQRLVLNAGVNNQTLLQDSLFHLNNLPRVSKEVYGETPFLLGMTKDTFGSLLGRTNILRQVLSLWAVVTVFGWMLYLMSASFSYMFIFDRSVFNHPRYLKNQMALEIKLAISAIPWMSLLTVPWFALELHGYSKLYFYVDTKNHGIRNILLEFLSFIFFTDCGVYFGHRFLHYPPVYKRLHKPHHKWLVCTPFASHAFHPVDGYIQSLPYHLYPMLMPLNKVSYLLLFTFVNCWTVMIHDGNHMANSRVVNGTACHTVHHLYFNYNYGQFTTLWDRIGGSYRRPEDELFDPGLKDEETMKRQVQEIESYIKEVEGDEASDRVYGTEESLKKVN
ncbi:c-5 sterol desaturase [Zygosaccharomyces mellis]|uniref:C-5 sterol desaturase n=1 Tax=Zygosaccharomyces mellis TaxID=42258 RepID=A0A4C2ECB2_9SACH|nr:c-5 sterol desaturase [Zygosaccharomyces mellis]